MKAAINFVLYQPLFNLLIFLAWLIPGHSIALAIIVLTVIIRLILLPSSLKAAHYQVKSLEMQPKINKIRAEIKDQKEQSQALMALYKEEGFSPFGSCLPLLIQIPIIWVLFAVFRSGLKVGSYSGLYHFMPHPSTINTIFLGMDITKADPWVLPIVAGVLQLLLSYLTMLPQKRQLSQKSSDPTTMMSKQMLYIAPLITVFFGHTMPAALVIYWITTTIFGVGQQWYVYKQIQKQRLAKIADGTEAKDIVPVETVDKPVEEKRPQTKRDMLTNIMNKRLDKQEKKLGVSVTVRTKKK
jgi:YidC/Oxa1 family membrane protein insertase